MIPSHLFPILALSLYLLAAAFSSSDASKKIAFVRYTVGAAILFHAYSLFEFFSVASLHLLAFLMSAAALVFSMYFVLSGGGKFKSFRQLVLGFIIILFLGSSVLIHLGHGQNINVKSVYLLWSHVGFSLIGLFIFSGIRSFRNRISFSSKSAEAKESREVIKRHWTTPTAKRSCQTHQINRQNWTVYYHYWALSWFLVYREHWDSN